MSRFSVILLWVSFSVTFSQKGVSQVDSSITYSKYLKASLLSSYGSMAVLGFVEGLSESRDEEGKRRYVDSAPDFFTPFYKTHLVIASFYALSSTIGLTVIGQAKTSIFYKTILFQAMGIGSTVALYQLTPWTLFGTIVYDFAIPVINAKIAYHIDKNYLLKRQKCSFQAYWNPKENGFALGFTAIF